MWYIKNSYKSVRKRQIRQQKNGLNRPFAEREKPSGQNKHEKSFNFTRRGNPKLQITEMSSIAELMDGDTVTQENTIQ